MKAKLFSIILGVLFLGGCSFLESLPAPLFDATELPSWYVDGNTAVADGLCTALTTLFGGC